MRKPLVIEDGFRRHLSKLLSSEKQVSDCISRCKRVEQFEGNLYDHYSKDRGRSLLDRLSYSMDDVGRGLEAKHNIMIDGKKGYKSIYDGTASLRKDVQHYFDFLKQQE